MLQIFPVTLVREKRWYILPWLQLGGSLKNIISQHQKNQNLLRLVGSSIYPI